MKNIRILKFLSIMFLSAIMIVSLSGCDVDGPYEYSGLDNFGDGTSDMEITLYLLPKNMLTEYEYVDGNYYYYDPGFFNYHKRAETAFIYLIYDKQTYPLAKEFMFNNTDYTENNRQSYNGYEFYDNIARAREFGDLDDQGNNLDFLRLFNMIGYNDDKNTLVFMGFTLLNLSVTEKLVEEQGWGAFLKEYFSVYDFDA